MSDNVTPEFTAESAADAAREIPLPTFADKATFTNVFLIAMAWSVFSTFLGALMLARAVTDYLATDTITTSVAVFGGIGFFLAFVPFERLFFHKSRAILKNNPFKAEQEALKNKSKTDPTNPFTLASAPSDPLAMLVGGVAILTAVLVFGSFPVFIVALFNVFAGNAGFTVLFWLLLSSAYLVSLLLATLKSNKQKDAKTAE
jgi:hypothetical protein